MVYVVGRGGSGRPTLQHRVENVGDVFTKCGVWMLGWSRAYSAQRIPEIYCRKCQAQEPRQENSRPVLAVVSRV